MFPVTCTTASLSEPARAGDRHTISVRSQSVGIPSKTIGLPGIIGLPLWELALQAIWAQTLTTLLKVTNIPLDQISTPFLWNIWSVASYQFVLKPITTSYNQDPDPL